MTVDVDRMVSLSSAGVEGGCSGCHSHLRCRTVVFSNVYLEHLRLMSSCRFAAAGLMYLSRNVIDSRIQCCVDMLHVRFAGCSEPAAVSGTCV